MHWKNLLIIIIIVILYILIGAAIFLPFEQEHEKELTKLAHATFNAFISNNTCVTTPDLETFVKFVIKTYDSGVLTSPNTSDNTRWNYGSAIFYAITVITTIGYGHLSPSTSAGQIFFTFYAIVGIPICATMLVGIGERFARPYMKFDLAHSTSRFPRLEKTFRMFLFSLVCFTVFSLVPAAIIMHLEDWSYLETWYYTVVTLTTVGFGDYIPDNKSPQGSPIYKILIGLWIFCGLSWLAMVFHMVVFYIKLCPNKIDTDAFEVTRIVEGREKIESPSSTDDQPLHTQNDLFPT